MIFSEALSDVINERIRQQIKENNSTDQDDGYCFGELVHAADCYLNACPGDEPPYNWPFGDDWWKPSKPRRNLVKAAALIVAEIERIDRYDAKD